MKLNALGTYDCATFLTYVKKQTQILRFKAKEDINE